MATTVKVNGVQLRIEAARAAEAVGVDPADDVRRLRAGEVTPGALVAECLDGVGDDRALEDAWREYVSDVCLAASRPDDWREGDELAVMYRTEDGTWNYCGDPGACRVESIPDGRKMLAGLVAATPEYTDAKLVHVQSGRRNQSGNPCGTLHVVL